MKQPLAPGDVLVVAGETPVRIHPAKGTEFAFWGFSLRLEHLFPLFAGTEISLLQIVTESLNGHKFYPVTSPVAKECHKLVSEIPPQFNLDHRGQLLRVAAAILSSEFKEAHGRRVGFVRAEDHLVQVFEKLSADEMLSLSVDELAERFGCSRRHLNRLFHQYFGYSVSALRMEMRLLKAVSLLRDCDAKVIHVAEQCGFNHLGLFNTCFRRRFGTSPGQWRKAESTDGSDPSKTNADDPECPLRLKGLCPWPAQAAATCASAGAQKKNHQRAGKTKPPAAQTLEGLSYGTAAAQKVNHSIQFQVRAQL